MTDPGGLNMRSEGKAGIKENSRFQALGTGQGAAIHPETEQDWGEGNLEFLLAHV